MELLFGLLGMFFMIFVADVFYKIMFIDYRRKEHASEIRMKRNAKYERSRSK